MSALDTLIGLAEDDAHRAPAFEVTYFNSPMSLTKHCRLFRDESNARAFMDRASRRGAYLVHLFDLRTLEQVA